MSFIHLHVYSAYSLLTSTASVPNLVENAKKKGFSAIAITDRNVMYGTIEFYKLCKKFDIKPIIGLTINVQSEEAEAESFPLVLLAENEQGFKNLLKISSAVQTKSPSGIPFKWLKHYAKGLIAITPGIEGEIEQYLAERKEELAETAARKLRGIFGNDHLFFSIQDHHLEKERLIRDGILSLSQKLNIPIVATNSVQYLEKDDSFAHEVMLAIKNGDKVNDENHEKLGSDHFYLKTPEEMVETFSEIPEALENTIAIEKRCQVNIELNKTFLPVYPTENGMQAEDYLDMLCKKGLAERITNPSEEYQKRLAYELSVIKRMKFSNYFLIVWDFMRYSRENGILTGPGRGSAAGSLVAYVLYITDVDPIQHHLLFERFLNPERISMPDIDIDFPDHRRDEVIEYVADKYGDLHVAQIVTFGTMAAKAALRDVGRAFGFNSKELDHLSRLIPTRLGISLNAAYNESEALRNFIHENQLNRRLYETALKLEGLPRHTSTHAAGVVISEKQLVDLIPIQQGSGNVYLTQYSMEYLEEIGLLKMDFLGLRNLSLIESILASIKRKTGKKVEIGSISLNDSETFELLASGETTGIFQLESEGMRKVLVRLKPSRFEDIVAVNALYRPGPMENIPLFIDRKHGIKPVSYPHPDLKNILENTYGVIVYQEQIMQIASTMAGFSLGEADLLRRAVGKKQKETLDRERNHFVQGALKKGYEQSLANEIYDLIVRFANYGFNRSHAVAYSMIAYQLAYLKAHYPLHFMAGLLTASIGNESKISQYIMESRQKGIKVLPPSINNSGYSFQVEPEGIRYSLAAIKGIGAAALKEIFGARKKKKFEDLFDFCSRISSKAINRKQLETLVHSGSFDEFGEDRAVLLASLDVAIEHAQLVNPDDSSQIDFFSGEEYFPKPMYVQVDPIRSEDKLSFEKEALGFYLSNHPVSTYEQELKQKGAQAIFELTMNRNRAISGIYVTASKKIRTKKGESMAFLTISDSSGEMEAVVFPAVYKRFSAILDQGKFAVVEGKVEEREGKRQFIIQQAAEMQHWLQEKKQKASVLYIKIVEGKQDELSLRKLYYFLKEEKGDTSVVLHYESTRKTVRLASEYNVHPTSKLLTNLGDFLGPDNVVLKE
ncbi:DNA polymerase III subunit alpha [Bacillus salipaludis]|uniref:DNA polymerase III subunit alpha n=1 Tax=Bacillus salipaludis TaxID=2547811 RepID=A0A4R5VRW5_9BACI|nr:DNA polymerase III subunit alpha [Bacillus salipaludis]MDQ6599915.1 DNA polymerase III subunit alpha [Bacillus salipaludis]TDK61479.1 DNA polymerase III subunit alpha [Bacillus salipaludis]